MTLRLMSVILLLLFNQSVSADTEISRQIDRDTWSKISLSVAEADIDAMASTYHPQAVVVSAEGTTPISEALEGWGEGMKAQVSAGSSASVEFRFKERLDGANSAFETGIFKYAVTDKDGITTSQFVNFESLLIKQDDRWYFLMERQLEATDQVSWDALKMTVSE